MLSSYRIQSNITTERTKKASNANIGNNSHREHDLKRPQKTSKDRNRCQKNMVGKSQEKQFQRWVHA